MVLVDDTFLSFSPLLFVSIGHIFGITRMSDNKYWYGTIPGLSSESILSIMSLYIFRNFCMVGLVILGMDTLSGISFHFHSFGFCSDI